MKKKSKNKKAVSPSTDSDEPEVIFSLRPFLVQQIDMRVVH